MGVNNLLLFDTLSVGRALSVLILLVLSGTGGALCGASAGVILGIAMDVAAGDGVLFSVVYAAAGLLSGQFCKHRRGFFLSTFAAAYLLALLISCSQRNSWSRSVHFCSRCAPGAANPVCAGMLPGA